MSSWKFIHQVYYIVMSCQFFWRKYILVDQVSCCDIKFLIFVLNIIFPSPSQLRGRNKKNICQVYSFINQEGLVTTRLKELERSGNYVLLNSTWPRLWISSSPTWGNFLKLFCLLFNQRLTIVWACYICVGFTLLVVMAVKAFQSH